MRTRQVCVSVENEKSSAKDTCRIANRSRSCGTRRRTKSGLSDGRDRSHGLSTEVLRSTQANILAGLTIGGLLGAVAGDVAGLAALVAGLSGSVERAAVWSRAVARDVAELAACVALHGLSLAIAREVVGPTALVARSRARSADETAPAAGETSIAATGRNWATAAHVDTSGVGASTL